MEACCFHQKADYRHVRDDSLHISISHATITFSDHTFGQVTKQQALYPKCCSCHLAHSQTYELLPMKIPAFSPTQRESKHGMGQKGTMTACYYVSGQQFFPSCKLASILASNVHDKAEIHWGLLAIYNGNRNWMVSLMGSQL